MAPRDLAGGREAGASADPWDGIADRLRRGGLRWTPQRRTLVEALRVREGHVTATELIASCRERDRTTTPSTVYRTLDVLEDLGLVRHGHGADGREEYHVLPERVHGHIHCTGCGATVELQPETESQIVAAVGRDLGFSVDLSHVTISGRCPDCRE